MTNKKEALWYTALATYGIGDIATTHKGLQISGVEEANPLGRAVFGDAGTPGLIGLKMIAFTGAGIAYGAVPEKHNVGIPIGLSLLGTYATVSNIRTIIQAQKAQE